MMGKVHVQLGAVCALGAVTVCAQAFGIVFAPDIMLSICQAGGYSLAPDLDQRASTATKAFPPLTSPLHHLTVWSHRMIYAMTRRAHDPTSRTNGRARPPVASVCGSQRLALALFGAQRPWRNAHRGLSHSLLTALFLAIAAGLVAWWHPAFALVVILFGVLVADKLVFAVPVLLLYGLSSLLYFGLPGTLTHLSAMAPLWGLSVLIGLVSHDLGDSCTKMGAALWAPWSWKMYRAPVFIETNGFFERHILRWILLVFALYFLGTLLVSQYSDVLLGLLRIFTK